MLRGEVWWAKARLPGGSGKRRPFVIVSNDAFNRNERYQKVMAVHVTTIRRPGGPFDWEVALPRGAANLPKGGTAKCGEVYTLLKEHFSDLCGTLDGETMARMDRALALALQLPR